MLETSFFWITEGIGLKPQKKIPLGGCHMNFWLTFSLPRKILTSFNVFGLDLM
jgi:hypothetical protein